MDSKQEKIWIQSIMHAARQTKTPVAILFELTSRCSLNCKMCYVHNLDTNEAKKAELSTDQWKRIMDEAFDCGMLFGTLSGGECMIRDDFKELYLHLFMKGIRITVLTNATLIDDGMVDFFHHYPPMSVQVSIYGSNDESYEKVTEKRLFHVVESNLFKMKNAGMKVDIAVTPSKYMTEDFKNILYFCKENGFNYIFNELPLASNRDDPEKNDYYLSNDDLLQLEIDRASVYRSLTPLSDLPPVGSNIISQRCGMECNAGNCKASISWDGYMSPCVRLPEYRESVLELGFSKAWERCVNSASLISQPVECTDCVYRRVCFSCPQIRSSSNNPGHCNSLMCDLTVKKCAAGIFKKL